MKCPYNKIINRVETDGYQSRNIKITTEFANCVGSDCPFYRSQRITINGSYESVEYCRKVEANC